MSRALLSKLALALWLLISTSGCFFYAPLRLGGVGEPSLEERELVESEGYFTRAKIAVIPISGTISTSQDEGWLGGGRNLVADVAWQLEVAGRDEDVRAVVVTIDSPGGGATASDQIWRELRRFRELSGKPVVASMGAVAASGGYYVAVGCDRIYAHPTTITGSIGVISTYWNGEGLLDLMGLSTTVIKSGPFKDSGSFTRSMTDDERQIHQGVIDTLYGLFIAAILEGRPGLSREQLLALADGRIYTAPQALEHKLIDGIGDLRHALGVARQLAQVKDSSVITYSLSGRSPPTVFGAEAPATPAQTTDGSIKAELDLGLERLLPPRGGRFLFLLGALSAGVTPLRGPGDSRGRAPAAGPCRTSR